ncbi:MAG TPA: AI-2E family transporter [Opitutaceae bacterium]|jgi:predicted PurR-regulated permease PerM|nr:AI-2E family transporter [Opitutaceae bacterium]
MLSERESPSARRRSHVEVEPVPVVVKDVSHYATRNVARATSVQVAILVLAVTVCLYFGRPVILPVVLAFMAVAALKPVMRFLARMRVPTIPSAMLIFSVMVAALIVGFVQAGRPAMAWIDEAPQHMADMRTHFQKLFPSAVHMGKAVSAVSDLTVTGAKKDPLQKVPTVEIRDPRNGADFLNWTETFLAGLGEVLVLVYLLLASGDMFFKKLVRVMPTDKEKKRAAEICHEVQLQVSNYLSSVSGINICLGAIAGVGFFFCGVPHPAMWGAIVALLNFVPYFGPVVGLVLVCGVGVLTFDTVSSAFMPFLWYLVLHLLEANFVTPILLGRRFTLNPVAIFISLMFWLWLWGIPGALISVPLLVSVKAICDRVPKAHFVSEFISR